MTVSLAAGTSPAPFPASLRTVATNVCGWLTSLYAFGLMLMIAFTRS